MIENANALYYTLSTIAQTLAGALAVLVAVVLFNFSRIDDAIRGGRSLMETYQQPPEESLCVLRNRGLRALKALMAERGAYLTTDHEVVAANHRVAWQVRPRFRRALRYTLLGIAVCFAGLPFTRALAHSHALTIITLGLTFAPRHDMSRALLATAYLVDWPTARLTGAPGAAAASKGSCAR